MDLISCVTVLFSDLFELLSDKRHVGTLTYCVKVKLKIYVYKLVSSRKSGNCNSNHGGSERFGQPENWYPYQLLRWNSINGLLLHLLPFLVIPGYRETAVVCHPGYCNVLKSIKSKPFLVVVDRFACITLPFSFACVSFAYMWQLEFTLFTLTFVLQIFLF